jgi:hypothetical protein
MRFAHLKTHHRFERMRLRGLSGARDEFHLAATVQNLKKARSAYVALERERVIHVGKGPPSKNDERNRTKPVNTRSETKAAMAGDFLNSIDPKPK